MVLIITAYSYKMNDFEEIRNAIGDMSDDTDRNDKLVQNTQSITVMATDPIVALNTRISRLNIENAEIKAELSDLRAKIAPLLVDTAAGRKRTKAKFKKSGLFEMGTPSTSGSRNTDANDDASSIVNVLSPESVVSDTTTNRDTDMNAFIIPNPRLTREMYSNSNVGLGRSAIGQHNYANKKQLWGTAVALLIRCSHVTLRISLLTNK